MIVSVANNTGLVFQALSGVFVIFACEKGEQDIDNPRNLLLHCVCPPKTFGKLKQQYKIPQNKSGFHFLRFAAHFRYFTISSYRKQLHFFQYIFAFAI